MQVSIIEIGARSKVIHIIHIQGESPKAARGTGGGGVFTLPINKANGVKDPNLSAIHPSFLSKITNHQNPISNLIKGRKESHL